MIGAVKTQNAKVKRAAVKNAAIRPYHLRDHCGTADAYHVTVYVVHQKETFNNVAFFSTCRGRETLCVCRCGVAMQGNVCAGAWTYRIKVESGDDVQKVTACQ